MATTPTARRRAPAMSGDDRRAAIIEATLPLLAEHGTKVTTSQIAQAAGIAEGTVFRVFHDKQELIDQCLQQALHPEDGLVAIRSISRDLTLRTRLRVAAATMTDRMRRIGALMHALSATGYRMERVHDPKRHSDREQWIRDTTEALAELIGPDTEGLRLPAGRSAEIFFGMVFSSQFACRTRGTEDDADEAHAAGELVDVFLHGVLDDPTRPEDHTHHGGQR